MLGPWRSSLLQECVIYCGAQLEATCWRSEPLPVPPQAQPWAGGCRGFSDRTLSGCRQRPLPGWGQELVPSPVTPTCPEVGLLRATSRYSPFLRNATPREWGGWRGLLGPEGAACRA